jgi:hypothetical protein
LALTLLCPIGNDRHFLGEVAFAEHTVGKGRSDDTWRMVKIETNAYRDRLEQAFAERREDWGK